ncbi:uncharacterized protein LOC110715611 [Chenopodium quinoa]|uniref:uncharacterized protein LOC110715611 n=1 Tax=Chenopodium quinoa TaxID=63459 RepID=UPI000B78C610|nr:uncharacterized protein LOC110715611 [Chenopodium quinoa]
MAKDDDSTPPPPPTSEFHPALAVNNIKNAIPLVLDYEKVQYSNWVELFENHACAYNVLDHIDPTVSRPTDVSAALWKRLDAIVKQWIYGTISTDLLNTILAPKSTAQNLWDRIREIFQDNKNTRVVYLENQFNLLHISNFSNVTAYCQQLKSIADQLANIDQPVSEQKMVIRLVSGLTNSDFDTVATMIQQTDPLPSFNSARSRLLLEESRRTNDQGQSAQSSFVAQQETAPSSGYNNQQQPPFQGVRGSGGRGRGGRTGAKGGGGKGRGKGRGNSSNKMPSNNTSQQQPDPTQQQQWPNPPFWPGYQAHPWQPQQWPGSWATPPCPYPSIPGPIGQPLRQSSPSGPSLTSGPSQQAYMASPSPYGRLYTPMELGSAYSTMTLPNPDNGWYMDSGATSHMTHNSGPSNGEDSNEMH